MTKTDKQTAAAPWRPLLETAMAHYQAGRLEQAVAGAEDVLKQQADQPDARHILGLCLARRDDYPAACAQFEKALAVRPENIDLRFNAARIFEQAGPRVDQSLQTALSHYHHLTKIAPEDARFWHRLGRLLSNAGQRHLAVPPLRRAVAIDPDNADINYSLGVCLNQMGDSAGARPHLESVLKSDPDHYGALVNLGAVCLQLSDLDAAERWLRQAIDRAPEKVEGYSNLGTVMMRQDRWDAAVACYQQGLERDPKAAGLLSNMAIVLTNQARHKEARQLLERAIQADSSINGPWDNLLFAMLYDSDITPAAAVNQHLRWGEGIAALPAPALPAISVTPDPDRPLRVGFLSPDFCHHPVGHFITPLLERLGAHAIVPIAFAQVGPPDSITRRVQATCDDWIVTNALNDAQIAAVAREKQIDVMIDLAGHTNGNRLRALALRAAPIQATYLGYPATTGLAAVDWRLTDRIVDPPDSAAAQHSEQLAYIPDGFLVYDPPEQAPAVAPAPILKSGAPVFGSFNNLVKLSAATVALWAEILTQVPEARLLLKSRPLGDKATADRVAAMFAAHGIDRARLDLRGRDADFASHLAAYGDMDIGLDPIPYNGTTTSFEALWMGVPIIALAGPAHVSRVTASLLVRLGQRALVAKDEADYVARAVALAADQQRLAALRPALRQALAASPLTDMDGFAGRLAGTLRALWHDWCAQQRGRGPTD